MRIKAFVLLVATFLMIFLLNPTLSLITNGVLGVKTDSFVSTSERGRSSGSSDRWDFGKASEWGNLTAVDDDSVEVVIGLRDTGVSKRFNELKNLIAGKKGELINTISWGETIRAVVVDIPFNDAPSFVAKVRAAGLSRYIEPNIKFETDFVPSDLYWDLQWGPSKIEADYAWNTTIGDSSVLVAVIDTGIDWNHPDLASNYVTLGYDWVNDDLNPMDDNGHGTHCAGIIGAVLDNSVGMAGLAQVRIMAEKGLDEVGTGWESDLANAIGHAVDQGAVILNLSWGSYEESALIHDAVMYAHEVGVLVVASAGNDAVSQKQYPAAFDEVVAVSATSQYDSRASWSNFGQWVEVAAPGVSIYSTILNGHYGYKSGTSMSAPHVAGVAALITSQFPNAGPDWVRFQLRNTTDDLGDSGFDQYYGYGRINARRALEEFPSTPPLPPTETGNDPGITE